MREEPFRVESRLISWALQLRVLDRFYRQAIAATGEPFASSALRALGVDIAVPRDEVERVPRRGPLIIAANHPHGAIDGLALAAVIGRVRPDVRLLANHLLSRIPELRDLCFFVDPFERGDSAARSRNGLRAAHLWLRRGGSVIVFPAGEVAHRRVSGRALDSAWKPTVARLALATGAAVVPAFIDGGNSRTFYAAGRVHHALRTVLLARELLKKRGATVTVRFGCALPVHRDPAAGGGATETTGMIRAAVESLAGPERSSAGASGATLPSFPSDEEVAQDIARLPSSSMLVESGAYQVFCVEARQIPAALEEIGRLRETTFRAAGEGTGGERDLDRFDRWYLHLFSWDREQRRIVGAYRLGLTDRIVAMDGVNGLYTRTLFNYDDRLIAGLGPALELGRSFVRAEYQKNYSALLLLWKGIGQFVVRHPRYRVLFGPVSISSRYSDATHRLLASFLQQNHLDRQLAELVTAMRPTVTGPAPAGVLPRTIDEANEIVSAWESDGKGVPVLLRQYLKLNARLIGFNRDPDFGDVLDALMMVDLTQADPAILARYFGRQESATFLAHHRQGTKATAA